MRGFVDAGSEADVFIPEVLALAYEARHSLDALGILDDARLHPFVGEPRFRTEEMDVLGDDDARELAEQRGAAAHRTGRPGRVEHALAIHVRRLSTGVLEGVFSPCSSGPQSCMRRFWPRPRMRPLCTSTEPIGMPPSFRPSRPSSMAA